MTSFLQKNGIPINTEELYIHPNYSPYKTLSKCINGYKYKNGCNYGFSKWMHYEEEDIEKYIFAYGNIEKEQDNDMYLFRITILKYEQMEAYAGRINKLYGEIVYNYKDDSYVLQGKWTNELTRDKFMIDCKLYDTEIEIREYNSNEYKLLKDMIEFIN